MARGHFGAWVLVPLQGTAVKVLLALSLGLGCAVGCRCAHCCRLKAVVLAEMQDARRHFGWCQNVMYALGLGRCSCKVPLHSAAQSAAVRRLLRALCRVAFPAIAAKHCCRMSCRSAVWVLVSLPAAAVLAVWVLVPLQGSADRMLLSECCGRLGGAGVGAAARCCCQRAMCLCVCLCFVA